MASAAAAFVAVGIIPDMADNVVEVAAQPLIFLGVLGRAVPVRPWRHY